MRSRNTSLSERGQLASLIEVKMRFAKPEIQDDEHDDVMSPEEEEAIRLKMTRRASASIRRSSEQWINSQSTVISRPMDMSNNTISKPESKSVNMSRRRSSAGWINSNSSIISLSGGNFL